MNDALKCLRYLMCAYIHAHIPIIIFVFFLITNNNNNFHYYSGFWWSSLAYITCSSIFCFYCGCYFFCNAKKSTIILYLKFDRQKKRKKNSFWSIQIWLNGWIFFSSTSILSSIEFIIINLLTWMMMMMYKFILGT